MTPLQISSDSTHPLKYEKETKSHRPRSIVTVSTVSSIAADTVASLGGKEAAEIFVESVTATFADKFSDELERKLQERCGDPVPLKVRFVPNSIGTHCVPHPEAGHGIQDHEKDFQGSKVGETENVTTDRKSSIKEPAKHLEGYAEEDLPTHLVDSPQDDPDVGSNASLWCWGRTRTSDQDAQGHTATDRSATWQLARHVRKCICTRKLQKVHLVKGTSQ